jgi:signal transduction histidine kinase
MEISNRKKVVRTHFLIFPQFQLRLLGANLAVIVVISAIIWYQMTTSFSDLQQAAGISGVEAEFYRNYLAFHSRQLNIALGASFVTAMFASTIMTLFLSHRFSGPLVRLRGYFRQLSEQAPRKPLPQLNFRRGDFLSDLPPLVNQALDRIQRESEHSAAQSQRNDHKAAS